MMQAVKQFDVSNLTQAASNDPSKREHTDPTKVRDSMYARLRRLEQRIIQLETQVSTLKRDTWRIEKKQQRTELPAPEIKKQAAAFPPGLFE